MENPEKKIELLNHIRENILRESIVKDPERAEEIARRWMNYN